MLMLIASLKGIDDDVGSVVDELISSTGKITSVMLWLCISKTLQWFSLSLFWTGLDDIQHEKCESYSDGSKRILSTVLSLIGNPQVIFLDEPADDIDSESRRHVYDIFEQVKLADKILVLGSKRYPCLIISSYVHVASHYTNLWKIYRPKECELLCDRITMLMNGVMHCIGNPQDLRNQFSLGYFVMIKVNPDPSSVKNVDFLEKNIINVFGSESCRLIADYKVKWVNWVFG